MLFPGTLSASNEVFDLRLDGVRIYCEKIKLPEKTSLITTQRLSIEGGLLFQRDKEITSFTDLLLEGLVLPKYLEYEILPQILSTSLTEVIDFFEMDKAQIYLMDKAVEILLGIPKSITKKDNYFTCVYQVKEMKFDLE